MQSLKSGFTLMEVMIATAFVATAALIFSHHFFSESKIKVMASDLQSYEELELKLRPIQKLDAQSLAEYGKKSKDPILEKCLSQPCAKECKDTTPWSDITWGEVSRYEVTEGGKTFNIGSAFNKNSGKKCPLRISNGHLLKPYWHEDCKLKAYGRWKSTGLGTILVEVLIKHDDQNFSRVLEYYYPTLKDPTTGHCDVGSAVSCAGKNIYLHEFNLDEKQFQCRFMFNRWKQ